MILDFAEPREPCGGQHGNVFEVMKVEKENLDQDLAPPTPTRSGLRKRKSPCLHATRKRARQSRSNVIPDHLTHDAPFKSTIQYVHTDQGASRNTFTIRSNKEASPSTEPLPNPTFDYAQDFTYSSSISSSPTQTATISKDSFAFDEISAAADWDFRFNLHDMTKFSSDALFDLEKKTQFLTPAAGLADASQDTAYNSNLNYMSFVDHGNYSSMLQPGATFVNINLDTNLSGSASEPIVTSLDQPYNTLTDDDLDRSAGGTAVSTLSSASIDAALTDPESIYISPFSPSIPSGINLPSANALRSQQSDHQTPAPNSYWLTSGSNSTLPMGSGADLSVIDNWSGSDAVVSSIPSSNDPMISFIHSSSLEASTSPCLAPNAQPIPLILPPSDDPMINEEVPSSAPPPDSPATDNPHPPPPPPIYPCTTEETFPSAATDLFVWDHEFDSWLSSALDAAQSYIDES